MSTWSDIGSEIANFAPEIGGILGGPVGAAVGSVGKMVANALGVGNSPDAVKQALKTDPQAAVKLQALETQVAVARIAAESSAIKEQSQNIRAEADSKSWMAQNWRPLTMLVFVFIIANNFILQPYLAALFGFKMAALPIPPDMWGLLKLGIGGYVIGRSAEKVAPSIADAFANRSKGKT